MNQRERVAVDLLDEVLRVMSRLNPPNPADVRAIAVNLPLATSAAAELTQAIGAVRHQDWDSVDYHLSAAAKTVGLPGRRRCVRCARSGGELTENGCPRCGQRGEVRWIADRINSGGARG